jgi:hypothetical protein
MKKNDTAALEDVLNRYLDGTLGEAEKAWLEELQAQDAGIKQRVEDLDTIHQTLHAEGAMQPSAHFTQGVMAMLEPLPQQASLLPTRRVWRSVALLTGVLAVTGIIITWLSTDMFAGETVQQVAVPYADRWNLPYWSIAVKGKWLLYPVIAMNMVLGWILLDRAILKPLFQHRRLNQA